MSRLAEKGLHLGMALQVWVMNWRLRRDDIVGIWDKRGVQEISR